MKILDGKLLSKKIKEEIKSEVDGFLSNGYRAPHLVAVLVGEDPASKFYVKSKMKSCEQVGFRSTNMVVDKSITQADLLNIIDDLNKDQGVDGYIVQLPLPEHLDVDTILEAISPDKDVDGFHPVNMGKLILGLDTFVPATPLGILEIIKRYNIPTEGKDVVIVGRSNIVGKPISICLSQKGYPGNSTVTIVHSRTQNIEEKLKQADIIIAAIGKPQFVKEHMVKEGAVVIDVGINRVEDSSKKSGYSLVGDVDFENVAPKCSYITPVPGGIGLMTVTALMINTLKSYKKKI